MRPTTSMPIHSTTNTGTTTASINNYSNPPLAAPPTRINYEYRTNCYDDSDNDEAYLHCVYFDGNSDRDTHDRKVSTPSCTTVSETIPSVSLSSSYGFRSIAEDDHSTHLLASLESSNVNDDEFVLDRSYDQGEQSLLSETEDDRSGMDLWETIPPPTTTTNNAYHYRYAQDEPCRFHHHHRIRTRTPPPLEDEIYSFAPSDCVACALVLSDNCSSHSIEKGKVPDVISFMDDNNVDPLPPTPQLGGEKKKDVDRNKNLTYTSLKDLMKRDEKDDVSSAANPLALLGSTSSLTEEHHRVVSAGGGGGLLPVTNQSDTAKMEDDRHSQSSSLPILQDDNNHGSFTTTMQRPTFTSSSSLPERCSSVRNPKPDDDINDEEEEGDNDDEGPHDDDTHNNTKNNDGDEPEDRTTLHPQTLQDFYARTCVVVPADETLLGSELGLLKAVDDGGLELGRMRRDRENECACVVM